MRTRLFALACAAVIGTVAMGGVAMPAAAAMPALAQQGATDGQWRAFGADAGATKYSPLGQITRDNVGDLQIAWSRPGVDPSIVDQVPNVRRRSLIGTPLMIDGVLYSPNGVGLVEAFDPATGQTLWILEPMDEGPQGYLAGASTRGVAYWTDGSDRRILVQRQRYLYALDARTGQPYTDFGEGGRVDLTIGLQ